MGLELPRSVEDLTVNQPVQYKIRVDRDFLSKTRQKLELAHYPEEQSDFFDEDNWTQGAKVARVKELAEYWKNEYNWEEQEIWLNEMFDHFLVKLDVPGYGPLVLHYTHARSSDPNAIPLLFSHGWPGSFVEAVNVVEELLTKVLLLGTN